MAFIIQGVFMSKTVTSLQIKVNEVFIKPLKPKALLSIKESDDKGEESDILDIEEDYFLIQIVVLKIFHIIQQVKRNP